MLVPSRISAAQSFKWMDSHCRAAQLVAAMSRALLASDVLRLDASCPRNRLTAECCGETAQTGVTASRMRCADGLTAPRALDPSCCPPKGCALHGGLVSEAPAARCTAYQAATARLQVRPLGSPVRRRVRRSHWLSAPLEHRLDLVQTSAGLNRQPVCELGNRRVLTQRDEIRRTSGRVQRW